MKYIIFEKTNKNSSLTDHKLIMPIMFPDHITHSQVKIEGCEAVSAGYYHLNSIGSVVIYGDSKSLNLLSRSNDKIYLEYALLGMGTNAFIE